MAQYRFSAQVIGRAAGRSSVAAAAYRAGVALADERTGVIHDYTRRAGVLHAEIVAPETAPDWMQDRARLWNAVERIETRTNAQLARELQLSLPHELTDAQRVELVRDYLRDQFVSKGMIADFAIHAPSTDGDDRNHHAHVMLTMRELMGDGFNPSKATPTARAWNARENVETWREAWATYQNRELERHGHAARVDHRSFEAAGVDRLPTQHMGPAASAMERKGRNTRIGNENREVDARNSAQAERHGQAAIINLAIERERRALGPVAASRVDRLKDAHTLSWVDIERRFDHQQARAAEQLASQYGEAKKAMAAELDAIRARQEAKGWRRVVRNLTGRTARDNDRAAAMTRTLSDIAQRERETMDSLKVRQERERLAIRKQQAADVDRLKADLLKQQERRARPAPSPVPQQQSAERKERIRHFRKRQESQPVKGDFDKSRRIDQTPAAPAPTRAAYLSRPAPAPSPAGETPRPAQKALERFPERADPMKAQSRPKAPQRDFTAKATPSTPEPAKSRADYWNERAKAAPAPTRQQEQPRRSITRDKDRERDR